MFGETPIQKQNLPAGSVKTVRQKPAEGRYPVARGQNMPKVGPAGPSAIWKESGRKSTIPSASMKSLMQTNMMLAEIIQRLINTGSPAGLAMRQPPPPLPMGGQLPAIPQQGVFPV